MHEPIAIVGTACRFPGAANSPSKLWDLLRAPRDVIKDFPPDRLKPAIFYHENGEMHGRSNVCDKTYMLEEDVHRFDAAFFGINAKEAADMDPQQRILLEIVYEAFEAAGWSLSDVDGSSTSVYVGVMTDDHAHIQTRDPDTLGNHAATGTSRAILSNRISYVFNLQGASLTIDTACSSSLVALHLGVQALQRGETTQAVIAGSNLLLDTAYYIMESSMHMLSPDSRCRMWDRNANGYARGEGCAAVVLKALSQAVRDGDHIECVIRGTGVNSDGRTSGITMPSPTAQTTMIQRTYNEAGLDPVADRCQYFECHGTGTQAGDPVEAQAIRDALFQNKEPNKDEILYCGSIKTVIGHLEGCAGLAGVIKASLAIQNKAIPPNMHFNQLNPKIEPFYSSLEIPTTLLPWPDTNGGPRRASVNSFGFGGTNAHAVIESYESGDTKISSRSPAADVMEGRIGQSVVERKLKGPFVFSARTYGSLVSWLKQLLSYLRANLSLDLDSLSSTLHSNRTVFRYRATITATYDCAELIQKMEDQINIMSIPTPDAGVPTATIEKVRILGVFTGQGVQAARMGYALLEHCELFNKSIEQCETALLSIPDPPKWSLREELAADASVSRVSKAELSQPLCTAIQIALVDLLRACGVQFSAVIGHSSGEIGAAYAAGLLSMKDAIGISYYRGYVAHLARGYAGKTGGMMAASMAFDAAAELCSEQRFKGRITIAARNSLSSVTLSGDKDAVVEMKEHLDRNNVRTRILQVDTAYHSHHMLACVEAYSEHLRRLGVVIQTPPHDRQCRWYSTVRSNTDMLDQPLGCGLEAQYWVQNMVQPVLFADAVEIAAQFGTAKSTVIEIGPHPALRGPVNQTLKQSTDRSLQYTGCLDQNKNAMETFSEVLTTIWRVAPSSVDFAGWRVAFGFDTKPPPLKNLPPYAWDHPRSYWRESRVVHNCRIGGRPIHDLLGRLWNDSHYEHTWRNIFRLDEMPWLQGHVFQNQVIFPATGYISLALDATRALVHDCPVRLVEVRDMVIPTALTIGQGDEVEITFTIRAHISPDKVKAGSAVEAEFVCYSYPDHQTADRTCHGRLMVHVGEAGPTDLAPNDISTVELTPFNVDRFYRAASELGFEYNGVFRALTSLNKCWGHAKAAASWSQKDLYIGCTLHPAILDVALQAGLSTFASSAERSMPSSYIPVGIRRAVIDPNESFRASNGSTDVEIEAYMTTDSLGKSIETDINVRFKQSIHHHVCAIQIEGVRFQSLSEPQPSEDRNILAKTVWGPDAGYGLVPPLAARIQPEPSLYEPEDYERVALFYLQCLSRSVKPQELDVLAPHQKLIRQINSLVARTREIEHPILRKEWLDDSAAMITELISKDPIDADMGALVSSAERNLSLLKGGPKARNDLLESSLSDYYQKTSGASACNCYIAQLMHQISHKFPRINIFHICAGGSETISDILDAIGDAYGSYTCAGASDAVINELKVGIGPEKAKKLDFKVFDIEAQPSSPEINAGPYDVVISSEIFCGGQNVGKMLQTMRSQLRVGGFLILKGLTGASLRPTALMGCSDRWLAGVENANLAGPQITTGQWDKLLYQNSFSGIDCIFHDHPNLGMHGFSVFSTQAMDDRLDILRDPLASMDMITPTPVILIGGDTGEVSRLERRAEKMLRGWSSEVQVYGRFDQIDPSRIPPGSSVISLQDLDKPLFSSLPSANELENLKNVLAACQNVLWVTSGRLANNPYTNIMIGIGRSLRLEYVHLNLHYLDFEEGEPWDIQTILAKFFRLIFSTSSTDITDGMLWSEEPETVIKDSHPMIARVVPDSVSNEIYNAKRRRIVKNIDCTEPIEIAQDTASSQSAIVSSRPLHIPRDHFLVEVKLSVALNTEDGPARFLSYGRLKAYDDRPALALSKTDCSVVTIPSNFDLGSSAVVQDCDAKSLVSLARFLIALHVVSNSPSYGTTLVCGESAELAKVISCLAVERGRSIMFLAISTRVQSECSEWIYIHPRSPARLVKRLIPSDSSTLWSLSKKDADIVLPHLPAGCSIRMFDANALSLELVEEAVNVYEAHNELLDSAPFPTVVRIQDVPQRRDSNLGHLSLVTDWERHSPVPVVVRGLEPHNLFSPNKTYFFVGMAGELGQSLTYFMVRGGARYIVLASRSPNDNQHWVHTLQTDGIDIRLLKMDVTDRAQVRETVRVVRRTMPEIGGVANAALVLEPGVFANLSAASIAKQLKPKVDGTAHLDDEFKTDKLDFFLAFGSLLTVCGKAGQAIYHAGNAFMMSLVENRRRRGLAASILNFGLLVDVGYVARSDRFSDSTVEEWLRTDIDTVLSEADFHHVILQGIVQGHPDSFSGEVIMGLETYYDKGQSSKPKWVGTAFFSHMVRVCDAPREAGNEPSSARQWHVMLKNAVTVNEAISPITGLLSDKIMSMIHVSLHSIHPDEPLSALGIDSINAIAIRKWFWERFRVDISMMRILGRDSSHSIIRTVAQQYISKMQAQENIAEKKVADNTKEQLSKARADSTIVCNTPKVTLNAESQSLKPPAACNDRRSSEHEASLISSEPSPGVSSIVTAGSELGPEFIDSERLSYDQAGIFYLSTSADSLTSFNVTTRWTIDGPLHVGRFCRAFEKTMVSHDALRTCFFAPHGVSEVRQNVTRTKTCRLTRLESTRATAEIDVQKLVEETARHEYVLETGDTFQATLISHEAQWYTLVLGFHEIVIDTISIFRIIDDINRAYKCQHWSPSSTSYLEFTRQELDDVQSGRFDHDITYWVDLVERVPDPLPLLPNAKVTTRRGRRAYGHHNIDRELSPRFVERVVKIGQANGVTPMQFYLAAMQVFLCRLLNIDNIYIGVVHSSRDPTNKFRETVGRLANILPIRFNGVLGRSFPQVMEDTQRTFLSSLDHAHVPFPVILNKIRAGVGEGNMPVVQVSYNYRVTERRSNPMGEGIIALEEAIYTAAYDLSIDVLQSGLGGHTLSIRCTDDFYSLSATQFITEAFVSLLESLVQSPQAAVKDYRLFNDAQIEDAITLAHGPRVQHSWPDSLSTRFEQVAASFPDSVAVKDGSEIITYSQLWQKVGLYARGLLDLHATSGSRVAVLCKPSVDLYASMLAVFHIGAVFIPFDVCLPAARRHHMTKACQPAVLVYHAATATEMAENNADGELASLNLSSLVLADPQDAPFPEGAASEPGSDSYILFTSGSTGVPKGIKLHQKCMMNYAASASMAYGFGQIKVLQQTSVGFDMSFGQIYNAFYNGGTLVVAPPEARGDPDTLSKLILDEKIDWTMATPSEYSLLLTYAHDILHKCHHWRFAVIGGETLPERLIDAMQELGLPNLMVTNCYGPAEAFTVTSRDIPVHAGARRHETQEKLGSIGRVLPNTSVYITSENDGSLLPPGMPGEICIAGIGLCNGYLDPTLNDGKFVKNPFSSAKCVDHGFETMYKSGDRGIMQPDGSIVFLGRADSGNTMVKLRGIRIDLDEVAGAILEVAPDELADAVVTMRGDPQFLVCHVVFRSGKELQHQELIGILRALPLPRYMIPSAIVPLERMPVTPNGKLDIAALEVLPLPPASGMTENEAEVTEMAKRLRQLWIDVIGAVAKMANIGPDSCFFQVGGNSFFLVHLQHAINRDMGVKVRLPQLGQALDLRDMAAVVEREVNG